MTIPSISSMSPIRSRKDKDSKCFYCKGDINRYGPYYQESNGINLYHTKCLTCHQCKQDCSSEFYFTFKKINKHYLPTIYCKKDMNETCQHCGGSIEQGGLVTFLGYKYHEDHFRCAVCNVLLSHAEQAFELKKNLYCLKHFVAEYKNERLNQRAFLEDREIAKIKNKKSKRQKDGEEDDDEEDEEDEDEVGDEDIDFDVNNLDVRDFRNNDYSTKYCGGCSTMLLAGTNINEMRFRNSKKHEYWHLDCFLLFQRYKVILSPKFVDPRRYIMFNENASSINLNADLRNISKWLNLYYEKVEQEFTEISKNISLNDKVALYKGFNRLVLQIQALFNALQDIEFIIEDHYTKMRYFQYTDAKGSHLEKLNFTRYRTLKDKHIKIFSCFNNLLKSGVSHYDINAFTTLMLKNIDHIIAFILHKILIYNYLTKEKQLLSIFLTKINAYTTTNDDDYGFDDSFDEYLSDKSVDAASAAADGPLSRGNSTSSSTTPVTTNLTTTDTTIIAKAETATTTTTTNIATNNINNTTDITTTNTTLYPDLKCSKCNQDIKLEPFVIQIYNDDSPRIYRFHMTCTTPADMNVSVNVPVIPNAYGPTAGDLLFEPLEYAHSEYVSVLDQTVYSIRRLLKRWLAKEQQLQKQQQQRGLKVQLEDQIKQRRDDLLEQFHEQQSLL